MNQIKNTLKHLKKVSLADLDQVRLMNRTDQKFCLHINHLPKILEAVQNDYSILAIEGETIFNYDNTYFDTPDDQMFLSHQNGKLNRHKVRLRKYVQTDNNFLEVKFKNNKGRTIKKRIEREGFESVFTHDELNFISNSNKYSGIQLEPKINSHFHRLTLVDKEFTERITIDMFPGFKNKDKEITLNNLVIIEIKQSKAAKPAVIINVLKENKIRKQGFSKYCIGRALLEDEIKKNNFKPLLIKIEKEYHN